MPKQTIAINLPFSTMILKTLLPLLVISSSSSSSWASEDDHHSRYLPPTIQIIMLVHPYNKLPYLPYSLGGLELQNYPQDRLRLHLITERIFPHESYFDDSGAFGIDGSTARPAETLDDRIDANDRTIEMLKLWSRRLRPAYNQLELTVANVPMSERLYGSSSGTQYWNKDRFKFIIDTKTQELYQAYESWSDMVLFIDSDVILSEPNTLGNLTRLFDEYPDMLVVAPMLYSSGTYSNFWAGMNARGYYVRTDDYLPILERKRTGTFPVPMVHTCFMIDARKSASRQLTFDPTEVEVMQQQNLPYDDIIAFAKSASSPSDDTNLYVDNRHVWGYIPQPISDAKTPDAELRQTLLDLELDSLVEGPAFPVSPVLESYLEPLQPESDRLGVDQIYVINLRRRPERRNRMKKSLDLLRVKARFWEATDGKTLTQEYLDRHQIRSLEGYVDPYHKRPLTFGEIGCFLSHYRIWEHAYRMNYSKIIILEDDVRFERGFRAKWSEALGRFRRLEPAYDFLYLGRKLNGDPSGETQVDDDGFFVAPGYSYWTIGYMITLDGVRKLLHANPLGRMIPVDEFLPIMYGGHMNESLVEMYTLREGDSARLNALSLRQLLVYPTHYVGDAAYISDTEDSDKISNKNTAQEEEKEEPETSRIVDKTFREGKLVLSGEPRPPPTYSPPPSTYMGHIEL